MREIKWIVIHCTAGPQTQTVESILKDWKERLKWRNPGYHKIFKPDGEVVTLLPYENISNGVGPGVNGCAINLSYIGGVDSKGRAIDNRTEAQKKSLAKEINDAKLLFPNAKVVGHRDFSEDKNRNGKIDSWERMKECPCFEVSEWIKEI